MRKLFLLSLFFLIAPIYALPADRTSECIVLLHGLARTEKSLTKLEQHLENEGFNVVNVGYPSRDKTIEELSVDVIPTAINDCAKLGVSKVHFVTHSMGAILVRYYLQHNDIPNMGRVVMLSPPNKGSEVVDKFKDLSIFKSIYGPAGGQLGTGPDSLPNTLGAPNYEVGIITGDKTINPLFSMLIKGADDGTVSVDSARLDGMKDFLVVSKTHPFIMYDTTVFDQVIAFIRNGSFN